MYMIDSLKCFVLMENGIVFNFNTDNRISLCSWAQYLKYAKFKCQGFPIAFLEL